MPNGKVTKTNNRNKIDYQYTLIIFAKHEKIAESSGFITKNAFPGTYLL